MSPHMTGRAEPESKSDSRSAADLLDENGKVDVSKIHEITNAGGHAVGSPTPEEVTKMRQRLIRGDTYREVAASMDWGSETVRLYARGDREVAGGEPACPPVEYRRGEGWVVVDE